MSDWQIPFGIGVGAHAGYTMPIRIRPSLLSIAVLFCALGTQSQGAINLPQPSGSVTATKAWVFSLKDFSTGGTATPGVLNNQLQVYVFESNQTFGDSNLTGRINFMFTNNVDSPNTASS